MKEKNPAIIFCDESCHTGNNLLDNSQPVFVYATVHITNDEAKKYLDDLRDNILYLQNMTEIKSKIIYNPKNRKYILQMFHKLEKNIKIFIINKKYALACKAVETIIEPVISKFNNMMYSTGLQNMLATLFYIGLDSEFYKDFSDIIRKKTDIDFIEKYKNNEFIGKFLEVNKDYILEEIERLSSDKWSLDMSVTSLHALLTIWHQELQQPLKVIYDESKPISERINIFKYFQYDTFKPFINKLSGNNVVMNYHLSEIEAGVSENYPGLMIADLAAGVLKLGNDMKKLNIYKGGIMLNNTFYNSEIHRDFLINMSIILLNKSQVIVNDPLMLYACTYDITKSIHGEKKTKQFVETFFNQ